MELRLGAEGQGWGIPEPQQHMPVNTPPFKHARAAGPADVGAVQAASLLHNNLKAPCEPAWQHGSVVAPASGMPLNLPLPLLLLLILRTTATAASSSRL
jgi:hypothetical protein